MQCSAVHMLQSATWRGPRRGVAAASGVHKGLQPASQPAGRSPICRPGAARLAWRIAPRRRQLREWRAFWRARKRRCALRFFSCRSMVRRGVLPDGARPGGCGDSDPSMRDCLPALPAHPALPLPHVAAAPVGAQALASRCLPLGRVSLLDGVVPDRGMAVMPKSAAPEPNCRLAYIDCSCGERGHAPS